MKKDLPNLNSLFVQVVVNRIRFRNPVQVDLYQQAELPNVK